MSLENNMDVNNITGSDERVLVDDDNNTIEVVTRLRLDMVESSVLPIHTYTHLIDRNINIVFLFVFWNK